MNDIEIIYEKIKDEYDLILTNSLALDDGFSWDVPVILSKTQNTHLQQYELTYRKELLYVL